MCVAQAMEPIFRKVRPKELHQFDIGQKLTIKGERALGSDTRVPNVTGSPTQSSYDPVMAFRQFRIRSGL